MTILDEIVRSRREQIARLRAGTTVADQRAAAGDAPAVRDFLAPLRGAPPIRLIAEIKRASPSQGVIRADFDPPAIARAYQRGGASCLSVLTEEHFFQGSLEHLRQVRAAVDLPVLRKDFILDVIQVWEARAAGADAILLIAECLDDSELPRLYEESLAAGLTPLVELYDEANLERVLALEPQLVGVNNRDLNTFRIDLDHSLRIKERIGDGPLFVTESGIGTPQQVAELSAAGVDAMLVGQSLCEQPDICLATQQLLGLLPNRQ